jgi:hypothetical protein
MLILLAAVLAGNPVGLVGLVLVLTFSYTFALVPAAMMIGVLRLFGFVRVWHFAIAGFIAAVIGISAFLLFDNSSARSSFRSFQHAFYEFWPLLIIGPLVGVSAWIISEARIKDRFDRAS